MQFHTAAVLLVAMSMVVIASAGPGGRGGSSACKASFPNMAEPLNTFSETGEATQDLKCYMSCVMQDKGKMKADGTIEMLEVPNSKPLPADLKAAIDPCFGLTPTSDLCETAYVHNKCLWTNDPEKRFMRLFE